MHGKRAKKTAIKQFFDSVKKIRYLNLVEAELGIIRSTTSGRSQEGNLIPRRVVVAESKEIRRVLNKFSVITAELGSPQARRSTSPTCHVSALITLLLH